MDSYLQKVFGRMPAEAQESFCRTVFRYDDSDYAAQMRLEYYAKKLRRLGKNVTIGTGVKLINPQYIEIGDDVVIGNDVTLIARGQEGITLGRRVILCDRVYLDTENEPGGYIRIDHHAYIGTGTTLFGHKGLEIGDYALLAQNITLTPYSHCFASLDRVILDQGGHSRAVTIGRDCYIGMGVNIMYSGDVGEGAIVGAGATVVKAIPPYAVAVGSPAHVIRYRNAENSETIMK